MTAAPEHYVQADIKSILSGQALDRDRSAWLSRLEKVTAEDVEKAIHTPPGRYNPGKMLALISPAAETRLEQMARTARDLTIQRFGRTIRLYAPLYLSNYCINSCLYCGFNKNSHFERKRLNIPQALAEADIISSEGFSDILLVSGEDPDFISLDYLIELTRKLKADFSSVAIEIYRLTRGQYAQLFTAGVDGVTIYQETYNRDTYRHFHPSGPKADYDKRLTAPDAVAAAGMRELGLGVLLGLDHWRYETLALAEHINYLIKRYWRCRVSVSFPRLRPARDVDKNQFKYIITDKNLVQMITALRLCFADVGLVLSTREPAELRDRLIEIGVTKISAGSKTNPGGYSNFTGAVRQFEIADTRTPREVTEAIKKRGFEAVWKDWDKGFSDQ